MTLTTMERTPETQPTFAEIDADGAISDAVAAVYGDTRAAFLRRLAFGSAAAVAALTLPAPAEARTKRGDRQILNFDLVFEHLQSSFYLSAADVGTLDRMSRPYQIWAHTLGAHELAHVRILKSVLGRDAAKKPFFDFHGVTERQGPFVKTAVAMEDLTVALLGGQASRLVDRGLTAAIFSLLTVEARHAAWARHLAGFVPVANAFDERKSLAAVGRVVQSTRFIAGTPRTRARGSPPYTG